MSEGKRPLEAIGNCTPEMAGRRYLVRLVLAEVAVVLLFAIGSRGLSIDNLLRMALAFALVCFVGQWVGIALNRLEMRERKATEAAERTVDRRLL
ncbi:MAG TPA: hypothetical protein VLT36_17905 [Candidatus Dormibacteraeota bacterium]|nr:hypothetical protein [Candidatus Dormibacteraeota bacterium]